MNISTVCAPKKPTFCRYFAGSGTCFYGSECQFLHASPTTATFLDSAEQESQNVENLSLQPETVDDLFGQPMDLVFLPLSGQENGLPQVSKLSTYINRPTNSMMNAAAKIKLESSPEDDDDFSSSFSSGKSAVFPHLSNSFSALAIDSVATRTAPNPAASEFVPRSSTPGVVQNAAGSSFFNYCPRTSQGTNASSTRYSTVGGGCSLSASTSPLVSPRLTPQHSPLSKRRSQSPLPPISNDAYSHATMSYQKHVDGTTYFYPPDPASSVENSGVVLPSFHVYPFTPAHIANMKPKANAPSFFMSDELRLEILHRHSLAMAQADHEQFPAIPTEVDNYHNLCPIEPLLNGILDKSPMLSYVTSVYKATNIKTGLAYCLRRVHGFRLTNMKCMALVDTWKKLQHSNIVQLCEVFTTKAFGEHSIVFVHDYHPGAETMMSKHFHGMAQSTVNGISHSNFHIGEGANRSMPHAKGANLEPRQYAGLLPESLIWGFVVQLSSALRTIHAAGLAYRTLDPRKILITGKSRLRLNCSGIYDVLTYDPHQTSPAALVSHYQQEDLMALGKVVLALACNSLTGIQRDHIQSSIELVARNYSPDLRNLIMYLLTHRNRVRSVNDIMPMIGARFYTQLDSAQLRSDVIENELAKEVENGRLFRLVSKLGIINERPELNMDAAWSETGDRYLLKLFRDYLFHQVTEDGRPWIDMAHIVQCLNKLDAGVSEKICLTSRDEQNVFVVTYAELKQCFEASFGEILQVALQSKVN